MRKVNLESPGHMRNRGLKALRALFFLAFLLAVPGVAQNGAPHPQNRNAAFG